MSLRTEVESLIKEKNPRKAEYLKRDIPIILEYFGLGEESLGDKHKITKQYISKDVIKVKFKNKVKVEDFQSLHVFQRRSGAG